MTEKNQTLLVHLTADALNQMIERGVSRALQQPGSSVPKQEDLNDWITREQTANMLHISFPTLREYEKQKILVPYRIGRRVLYSRKEVEAKLREGFIINHRRK